VNRSKFSFNLSLKLSLKPNDLGNFSVSGGDAEPRLPSSGLPGTATYFCECT